MEEANTNLCKKELPEPKKIATTVVLTEDMFSRIDVPGDGSCLFWAVTMSYLLPVRNDESLFGERYARLFGSQNVNKTLHVYQLIRNDDCNYVYEDETSIELVTETFRQAVVDEMTKQEEEVYESVSLNDFLYMQNAAFITEGSFAQHFETAFPSHIHRLDLSKLKPSQLNQTTIDRMNVELDKISEKEQIQKFKFECYCQAMRSRKSWAGEREIQTINRMLRCHILIFNDLLSTGLTLKTNIVNLCIFNNHEIHFEFGLIKAEIVWKALVNKEYQTVLALLNFGVDKYTFRDKILQHLPASTDNYYHAIIKNLTSQGVHVNVKINEPTPLKIFATETCVNTDPNSFKQLNNKVISEHKSVLYSYTHSGRTILHAAIEDNNTHLVQQILDDSDQSVLINAPTNDDRKQTALHLAVSFGHLETVKYLVERGADVNSKDNFLVSVLSHAARLGFDHIAQYLIGKGAKVNAFDQRRMTAVHHAVKCGRWSTVQLLVEHGADVNGQSDKDKTPLSMVVRAGKWDVVRYLLNNNALLTGCLSGKDKGEIFDKFLSGNELKEQMYRAIKLGNVELLELLITKCVDKKEEQLNEIVSATYEKLRLRNVLLNQSMCVYIEDKLINFRFFSENEAKKISKGKNSKENFDVKMIKERLRLVIGCVNSFIKIEKINEEYLFIGKFIAKNMQILKRQLFSTYDEIPWEEMQFCLLAFISSYVNPKEVEIINKLVMHKMKLNSHLTLFKLKLEELEKSLVVINKKKLKREECKENIVKNNPKFCQLYEDFEILKDVYSLKQIEKHIKMAGSVNIQSKPVIGELVIERALQVIGECLKNTSESLNMSESVQNALIENAPLNMQGIITSLRDSLSHVETLTKREEVSQNDANFFPQMQDDLKKMEMEITYILYNKKIEAFKECLEEILRCENIDEVGEIVSGIEMNEKVVILTGQQIHQTFYKVESLIRDFESLIVEKTEHQMQCFRDISEAVEKYKARIHLVQNTHVKSVYLINSLIDLIKSSDDNNNLEKIKKRIRGFLNLVEPAQSNQLSFYQHVLQLIVQIFDSCPLKAEEKINQTFIQIFSTIEFECKRIKNIDRYKFGFEKIKVENDDDVNRNEIIKKIESKFSIFISKLSDLEARNLLRAEYERKKEVNEAKIALIGFYEKQLLPREDIDLIRFTQLLKTINLKPSKGESYSSLYAEVDDLKRKKIIERINRTANDSYGKLMKTLTNEPDNAFMQNAFTEYIKSFVAVKKLPPNFIEINEKLFYDVEIYFKKLKTLENIFDIEKSDVDLIKLMRENDDLRVAIEMLMLTLTEILENLSRFEPNPLFLDESASVLIGKNLRNYLAHGDLLMEVLSIDHLRSIVVHYRILKKRNCDVENELIGKQTLENIAKLSSDYESNLQLIKQQDEMFANPRLILDENVLNQNLEINCRKANGWTLLNSAAETDNAQLFNYLLMNNINIYQKDAFGHSILYYLPQFGSKKILQFLLKHFKIDIDLRMYLGRTMLHIASQFNRDNIVEFLLSNGAAIEAVDDLGLTAISFAAVNGHSQVVATLLKAGADVETTNNDGEGLLHLAAMRGCLDLVKSLIDCGCRVNRTDIDRQTPLHFACINGNEIVVKLLIENGADINAKAKDEAAPLHFATHEGHEKVVEILLANRALVNQKGKFGNTALHLAAVTGFENIISELIKYGADVNAINDNQLTPLQAAALIGHHNLAIKAVVENGADVNLVSAEGLTALHLAARNNHPQSVQMLLEKNALVNARDKNGNTPLHLTFNVEIINILLNSDHTDIKAVNNSGRTALHIATSYDKLEAVETLISRGAEVDAADREECTPLFVSALRGNLKIFQLLKSAGAKSFQPDKNGWTALHMAAQHNHEHIAQLLIANHTDEINCQNNLLFTPLHIAAQNGHSEVVKILLEKGAENDLLDRNKWTALHHAASNGHYKVVGLLLSKKAPIGLLNADGLSALHSAAQNGHKDVLQVILSKDAEVVDICSVDNYTPLHVAARFGQLDVVQFLLSKGADINAKNKTNWTALHLAAEKGHIKVVNHLLSEGAWVNVALLNRATPLHLAVQNRHEYIALPLLFKGADVNARYDDDQITALHVAAETGQPYLVDLFITRGADVDGVDANGKTPLHRAAANRCTTVVPILSKYKANMNARDANNWTPLHLAAENGCIECFAKMVHYGANIYALANNNWTALHIACQNISFNVVGALMLLDKSSILINKVTNTGLTALQLAAEVGDAGIVQYLINNAADINYTEPILGWTALHFAAHGNYTETVECLIKSNAELEIKSVDGATPLYLAVMYGHEAIVRILCAAGANCNSLINTSYTPLHLAAEKNYVSVANILIKAGANVNGTKNDGATPSHIAAALGHSNMVKLLVEAGAEIDSKARSGLTPLHLAVKLDRLDVARILIVNGADVFALNDHDSVLHKAVHDEEILELILREIETKASGDEMRLKTVINAQDGEGDTPLMWAVENGHIKAVELLLKCHLIDVDERNFNGWTALHWAARNGHRDAVQLLIDCNADVGVRNNKGQTAFDVALERTSDDEKYETTAALLLSLTASD